MKEDLKVSYEQIKKANEEIETIKLGAKGYAQVNERIKAYRKVYPSGSIQTEIMEIRDDYVRVQALVHDEQDRIIATGTASEMLTEAKYVIKVVIGDLMRKMGVVKASLSDMVDKELWTTLEEMTTHQLLRLEYELKTLNMESNRWHSLYNENLKIKDVVPKNQEVTYESAWYKFGKIALERAGTDELMRNDIINNYLEMGINLEASK